jgi:Mrp family chromosome partitioning ATPase
MGKMESNLNKTTIKNTNGKKNTSNTMAKLQDFEVIQTGEKTNMEQSVQETMRFLAAHIQKKCGEFPKRISLFSSIRGEGVTYICRALGLTLAEDFGSRICLVDLNWHAPSPMIGASSNGKGIADVLNGNETLDSLLEQVKDYPLPVLHSGKLDENKRPVVARSQALADLLCELDTRFDSLILDIPAILSTSDAVHLAGLASASCLVIRQGVTPLPSVKSALDETSHLNILGVVLNRTTLNTPDFLVNLVAG